MGMIVSLTALIAVTASAATVPHDDAPLDDLRVAEALSSALDAEADEGTNWLDLQGYADVDLEVDGPHGGWDRRSRARRDAHRYARGEGRASDGGLYGPRKDLLRGRADRFRVGGDGFVSMPGPGGVGGRIAADALGGDAEVAAEAASAQVSDTATVRTLTADAAPTQEATEAVQTSAAALPAGGAPALRLSFAKSHAPAASAGDGAEALPTPLPASALLFASGIGLLGLSRRKLA